MSEPLELPPPEMKFYIDAEGKCVGCYMEGHQPEGTTAVPVPPVSGEQIWNAETGAWSELPLDLQPISARQIRLALSAAGILAATEAAIAGASEADRIEWEYATEYRRDHALIGTMAAALSLSAEAVDAMWLNAMTL